MVANVFRQGYKGYREDGQGLGAKVKVVAVKVAGCKGQVEVRQVEDALLEGLYDAGVVH